MKNLLALILLATMVGCAYGKTGLVKKDLDYQKISKTAPIYVFPITTQGIRFAGDKAEDQVRIKEEVEEIQDRYHRMIVTKLKEMGYNAKVAEGQPKEGFIVKGNVFRFDHGSGAARFWVGMGAGSSDMHTDFKVLDAANKEVIGDFEIIATSGGRGGLSAVGSFMEAHLTDGSEHLAKHIAGESKK